MRVILGILSTLGVSTSKKKDHTLKMWKTNSYPFNRTSMSVNRFWYTVRFISFDNRNIREKRHQYVKLSDS